MLHKKSTLFIVLLVSILISCASSMKIGDIKAEPRKFHDTEITIKGKVDDIVTLPILGIGLYQIDDGTGQMWVKPKGDVPFKGEKVKVTGEIKVGISFSNKSFGVILIEKEEK